MAEEQQGGGAFGAYVRAQRRVAQLSLRQLSELTHISNPYLSQIERGLHQPSITVIKNLARALGVSVEALLAQAAGVGRQDPAATGATEAAIGADPHLDDAQKAALLAVYHSMVGGPVEPQGTPPAPVAKAAAKRAPAKKAPAERAPASKAPGKRAPASKAPGKRAPAKKAPTKRSAPGAS